MINKKILIPSIFLFFILAIFHVYSNNQLSAEQIFSNQSAKELSRDELEKEVEKLLKGDEILLRRNIDKVFKLASTYEQEGLDAKAVKL